MLTSTVASSISIDRGYKVSANALVVSRALTFDEWRSCGVALAAVANRTNWVMGDWLVYAGCLACIVSEFAARGQSFTATLWGGQEDFSGIPIEVRVDSADAQDARLVSKENTTLPGKRRGVARRAQLRAVALRRDVRRGSLFLVRPQNGSTARPRRRHTRPVVRGQSTARIRRPSRCGNMRRRGKPRRGTPRRSCRRRRCQRSAAREGVVVSLVSRLLICIAR